MYILYQGERYYDDFDITFESEGGTIEGVEVVFEGTAQEVGCDYICEFEWGDMGDYTGSDYHTRTCFISTQPNTDPTPRDMDINVRWDYEIITVRVHQKGDAIYSPIWKDIYYQTEEKSFEYVLKCDGATIFHGKAYKMPGERYTKVNINKICQNYLSCDIEELLNTPEDDAIMVNADAYKTFELFDENGDNVATYKFLYDWSYVDTGWNGHASHNMSMPVNGHYATNMLKMYTYFYRADDGTNEVLTSKVDGEYRICAQGDYAIYYLNSFGGWDAFLVEGNNVKSDSITEHDYNRSFNNTTIEYEQGRYISEIVTSFKFYTGWLNDEQSENLANNLLGSNHIYLHDLKKNVILPAIITNTKNDYKTYSNQGAKMVNYEVDLKLSQSKIRK